MYSRVSLIVEKQTKNLRTILIDKIVEELHNCSDEEFSDYVSKMTWKNKETKSRPILAPNRIVRESKSVRLPDLENVAPQRPSKPDREMMNEAKEYVRPIPPPPPNPGPRLYTEGHEYNSIEGQKYWNFLWFKFKKKSD